MGIRIAVCEDCPADAELLCGLIGQYCRRNRLPPFAVDVFSNGFTFSERCVPGAYDLIVMDIYLQNEDGMRLVREFRKLDQACPVIFFTRSRDHAVEAFQVNAAHYLTKPVTYNLLAQALDRCLRLCRDQSRYLLLHTDKALRKVLLSEIVFVEVFDNTSVVHLDQEEIASRITLKRLEQEIENAGGGAEFLRCHRSILVNMNRIIGLRNDFFLLSTKQPVPIAKYNRRQIIRTYEAFALERMRAAHTAECPAGGAK